MKAETLRKSILQYAMQGKLVTQIATEEPASALLEKIKAEKQELIKQGKIKKEKSLPSITDDEKPFDIPNSWEWVRFGELCHFQTGASFKKEQSNTVGKGIRVLRGGNINPLSYNLLDNDIYVPSELINDNILLKQNDIITPAVTSIENIGKAARIIKDYTNITVGGFVFIIRTFLNDDILSKYLMFSMFSTDIIMQLKSFTKKSGQAFYNLGREKFKNMPFPLPPFAEQKRIVARIEELMILVDQYEEKQIELEKIEKEFPDKLKKSILQYAIQGKLVQQIDTEEPASVLLKKIKAEKQELIKQGKIKKEKPLPFINEDEKPFEIPNSWEWVRIDEIVEKSIKRGKSPKYTSFSDTFVFAQKCNAKTGNINLLLAQHLDESALPKYPQDEFMQHNDIVVNSTGNGTMGRVGIFKDSDNPVNKRIVPDSHVTVVRTFDLLDSRYIYYYFKSKQSYLESMGDGSTNQTELKPYIIRSLLIPLPPLAEQQRIVIRVEELFELVDLITDGEKLKKSKTDKIKPTLTAKVVKLPIKENKPKFDVDSLGMVARADSGVTQDDVNDILRQVQSFYDKKN